MKLLLSSLVLTLCIACGKPPCDQLADQCAACTNAGAKTTCNASVAAARLLGSQQTCQTILDAKTYEANSSLCTTN